MSQSIFFDTHEFVKGAIATKADLHEHEARLQTAIVTAKFDLMKWIIMALIAQAGLVIALVKLL